MTNDQLIADLKGTRAQLEIRGRCKTELVNDEGKVCLDGAIVAAVLGEVEDTQAHYEHLKTNPRAQAVAQALFDQVPDDHPSFCRAPKSKIPISIGVFYYNDDPVTTDQDCFNLIDKALAQVGGLGT
jgi:hypothetical protein